MGLGNVCWRRDHRESGPGRMVGAAWRRSALFWTMTLAGKEPPCAPAHTCGCSEAWLWTVRGQKGRPTIHLEEEAGSGSGVGSWGEGSLWLWPRSVQGSWLQEGLLLREGCTSSLQLPSSWPPEVLLRTPEVERSRNKHQHGRPVKSLALVSEVCDSCEGWAWWADHCAGRHHCCHKVPPSRGDPFSCQCPPLCNHSHPGD